MKIVASYGGGVNSTAMLIGLAERGETVDLILFADTGGEKPETYAHLAEFNLWLAAKGFPQIVTVREERWTLEQECLTAGTLPSIVTGMRSCSDKFKIRPQNRYLRANGVGEHVKLIGFDAGEPHRVQVERKGNRYPLIEWNWGREECIAAIQRNGLNVPQKSSCFFCPEMQEWEIVELQKNHPELADRAIAMERNNTKLTQIKGLARTYSWEQILDFHAKQGTMCELLPPREQRLPCMCYDGE